MSFTKLFFSFEGRSGRKSYWIGIVSIEVGIFLLSFGLTLAHLPALVAVLVMAYPRICVIAKRFHDLNRSGWWQVLPNVAGNALAGLGGASVVSAGDGAGGSALMLLLSMVVEFGFLIWLGCVRGQDRKNDFGWPQGQKDVAEVFL
jgi:uncharacterized membrane protein YhaH (DUF805 family)